MDIENPLPTRVEPVLLLALLALLTANLFCCLGKCGFVWIVPGLAFSLMDIQTGRHADSSEGFSYSNLEDVVFWMISKRFQVEPSPYLRHCTHHQPPHTQSISIIHLSSCAIIFIYWAEHQQPPFFIHHGKEMQHPSNQGGLGDFKSMSLDNDEYTGKHIPKKATG